MKFLAILFFFAISTPGFANGDAFYLPSPRVEARTIIATLASPEYWGRGYTKGGMAKAADYLETELRAAGLRPLDGKSFRQEFTYAVNTFPGKVSLKINDKALQPGTDFLLSPDSRGNHAAGFLTPTESGAFTNRQHGITVTPKEKLTWSVARKVSDETHIWLDQKRFPEIPLRFELSAENTFVEKFAATNLAAIVPGTINPKSTIVMSAHYDHLGGLGRDTYFPGANDNASGVSLLLLLAKHYARHPAPVSMVFLFFAGEEAGLVGSKYFTEHPLLDLSKIKFLTNFDLAGTGEEGITAVNATEFPEAFEILKQANRATHAFITVNARGKAANSDHYWFSEKGVPAFFIYTLGGIKAYHDVYDRAETLPLTKFDEYFRLMLEFNSDMTKI